MCPSCNGLGTRAEIDPDLVITDKTLSIRDGAIAPWASAMSRGDGWVFRNGPGGRQGVQVNLDTAWNAIPKDKQKKLLFGIQGERLNVAWSSDKTNSHGTFGVRFQGVIPTLERLYRETNSDGMRDHYGRFFRDRPCKECQGSRLRARASRSTSGRRTCRSSRR